MNLFVSRPEGRFFVKMPKANEVTIWIVRAHYLTQRLKHGLPLSEPENGMQCSAQEHDHSRLQPDAWVEDRGWHDEMDTREHTQDQAQRNDD